MKRATLPLLLLFLVLSLGCGKSSVTGKVTFEDGTPLTVGKVMFTDGKVSGFGNINEKGEYRLGMIKEGDGMNDGTYKVYITGATKEDPALSAKNEDGDTIYYPVLIIDPMFTNPEKSNLTCDVSGKTTFDIKVKAPGPDYKPTLPTTD